MAALKKFEVLLCSAAALLGATLGRWTRIPEPKGRVVEAVTASVYHLWGIDDRTGVDFKQSDHNIIYCERPCNGSWIDGAGQLEQIDASYAGVWGY